MKAYCSFPVVFQKGIIIWILVCQNLCLSFLSFWSWYFIRCMKTFFFYLIRNLAWDSLAFQNSPGTPFCRGWTSRAETERGWTLGQRQRLILIRTILRWKLKERMSIASQTFILNLTPQVTLFLFSFLFSLFSPPVMVVVVFSLANCMFLCRWPDTSRE